MQLGLHLFRTLYIGSDGAIERFGSGYRTYRIFYLPFLSPHHTYRWAKRIPAANFLAHSLPTGKHPCESSDWFPIGNNSQLVFTSKWSGFFPNLRAHTKHSSSDVFEAFGLHGAWSPTLNSILIRCPLFDLQPEYTQKGLSNQIWLPNPFRRVLLILLINLCKGIVDFLLAEFSVIQEGAR